MFLWIILVFLVAVVLLRNQRSRPYAAVAAILTLVCPVFPPAALVAGICLIIAIFRLFF